MAAIAQWMPWVRFAGAAAVWLCLFVSCYHLLSAVMFRRGRWSSSLRLRKQNGFPELIKKMLCLPQNREKRMELHQQLQGCGFTFSPETYWIGKRLLFLLFVSIGAAGYGLAYTLGGRTEWVVTIITAMTGLIIICADKPVLEAIRRRRREGIIKEIYTVSHQLLYYEKSSMNLHAKLVHCIPFTQTIRPHMQRLANEWYYDAELAIQRFKERLGTDEGANFGETLRSLRQYDSGHFYELLRQRIADYKDKLDLLKDSKKETTSYVLFILAGIPILNTFRVFIYPWVTEGQKLFDSLH